jgi:hypothetical protein
MDFIPTHFDEFRKTVYLKGNDEENIKLAKQALHQLQIMVHMKNIDNFEDFYTCYYPNFTCSTIEGTKEKKELQKDYKTISKMYMAISV